MVVSHIIVGSHTTARIEVIPVSVDILPTGLHYATQKHGRIVPCFFTSGVYLYQPPAPVCSFVLPRSVCLRLGLYF